MPQCPGWAGASRHALNLGVETRPAPCHVLQELQGRVGSHTEPCRWCPCNAVLQVRPSFCHHHAPLPGCVPCQGEATAEGALPVRLGWKPARKFHSPFCRLVLGMRRRRGGPWPGRKRAVGPQIRCTRPASMTPKQGANAGPEGGAWLWGQGQLTALWETPRALGLGGHAMVEVLGASPRWQS